MPGDGTKTATTIDSPSARCLDLTRLISRVGRGPWTGVDRVERAYLRQLLIDPVPLFLLVKTSFGFALLDQIGAQDIRNRLDGKTSWGRADLLGHLARKASPAKRRAEADLRRLCIARCRSRNLSEMLATNLPTGCAYLNVGHSNLSSATLSAWKNVAQSQITVLIHDTIPLDFPEFQRPGTPQKFESKLKTSVQYADLIICNSHQTDQDLRRWAQNWGATVNTIVAHLGVDLPVPTAKSKTAKQPYFVCLGTIEPRKNHKLLLDIWESFQAELPEADIPHLHIIGARGWKNEGVFARLDTASVMNKTVFEHADMPDAKLTNLFASAAGSLFPSVAEGFGLPPAESVLLDVPVICTNLPVYREFLGNIPVYLESDDVYLWKQSIRCLAEKYRAGQVRNAGQNPAAQIPSWHNHFNLVLKVT